MKAILILIVATGVGIYLLSNQSNEIEPKAFIEAMKSDGDKILIDTRSGSDFFHGHIQRATNFDYSLPSFKNRIEELDTAQQVFIYCRDGIQNKEVSSYLKSQGFHSVTALKGGIEQWKSEGYQLTPEELIPPSELTFDDFSRMLDLEHFVLVEFYLPGNKNCRTIDSVLDELSLSYNGKIKILRIDIDWYKHLATEMGIEYVPTLQFYENGNLSGTLKGVYRKEKIDEDFQLKENSQISYNLNMN